MSLRENRSEDLLDHIRLADNDLLQFFLHQLPLDGEFLKELSQAACLGRGQGFSSNDVKYPCVRRGGPILAVAKLLLRAMPSLPRELGRSP